MILIKSFLNFIIQTLNNIKWVKFVDKNSLKRSKIWDDKGNARNHMKFGWVKQTCKWERGSNKSIAIIRSSSSNRQRKYWMLSVSSIGGSIARIGRLGCKRCSQNRLRFPSNLLKTKWSNKKRSLILSMIAAQIVPPNHKQINAN